MLGSGLGVVLQSPSSRHIARERMPQQTAKAFWKKQVVDGHLPEGLGFRGLGV